MRAVLITFSIDLSGQFLRTGDYTHARAHTHTRHCCACAIMCHSGLRLIGKWHLDMRKDTGTAHISDEELDNLMKDFGAVDSGDGLGHTIKYQVKRLRVEGLRSGSGVSRAALAMFKFLTGY